MSQWTSRGQFTSRKLLEGATRCSTKGLLHPLPFPHVLYIVMAIRMGSEEPKKLSPSVYLDLGRSSYMAENGQGQVSHPATPQCRRRRRWPSS
jgi:hypothetical protein